MTEEQAKGKKLRQIAVIWEDEKERLEAENARMKELLEKIKADSYPGLAVKESVLLNRIYKTSSKALKGE